MAESIPLEKWSDWLEHELFNDHDGDGRPVSIMPVNDTLLRRSLARGGVDLGETAARVEFIKSFPSRDWMLGWFSGGSNPGEGSLAFLVLCCFVGSEVVGLEENDYRERFREVMGWPNAVTDCSGLPSLWRALVARLGESAARGRRPLRLPDPRHRTQIGHAVELAFPSRQDAVKLTSYLSGTRDTLDTARPGAVIKWLVKLKPSDHFSSSFVDIFSDFEKLWREGDRTLRDHQFWSGWCSVVDSWTPPEIDHGFHVICDEWGSYRLLNGNDDPVVIEHMRRARDMPAGLRTLIESGEPVPLEEIDWGRWGWRGPKSTRSGKVFTGLVREKSHSAGILAPLELKPVIGAAGWSFTSRFDLLEGPHARALETDEELVDLSVSGPPRVDGGWLARPSFALLLTLKGGAGEVALEGDVADSLELAQSGRGTWQARATRPIEGTIGVSIAPLEVGPAFRRSFRLRRAALLPTFLRQIPDRYSPDEANLPSRPLASDLATPLELHCWADRNRISPCEGLLDIIEYLAARTGPLPLGGMIQLLERVAAKDGQEPWSVFRSLLEGGVIDPLRVRGWQGRAILSRLPRAAVVQDGEGFALFLDGLVNEVLADRFRGIAATQKIIVQDCGGASRWAIPTYIARAADLEALRELASELSLPVTSELQRDQLFAPIAEFAPDGDGSGHSVGRVISLAELAVLGERGVSIRLCDRERQDGPSLWMVASRLASPRFWAHRHIALLDACRLGGVKAFTLSRDRATAVRSGIHLPLPLARWMRITSGAGAGPTNDGYAYPISALSKRRLQSFLGRLGEAQPLAHKEPSQPRDPSRPLRAVASIGGPTIRHVWNWARSRSTQPRSSRS